MVYVDNFHSYSKVDSLNIFLNVGSVLLDIHDGSDLFLTLAQKLHGIPAVHEAHEGK